MPADFVLLTRGVEIPCRNAIHRPAVRAPAAPFSKHEPEDSVASSIVANYPRRWKRSRGCKIRTPAGDFIVTAIPHHDGMIRLEGKNIDAVARAIGL